MKQEFLTKFDTTSFIRLTPFSTKFLTSYFVYVSSLQALVVRYNHYNNTNSTNKKRKLAASPAFYTT